LAGVKRHDYLPFGEELFAGTGGRTPTMGYSAADGERQKFTEKERDNETGLDYFGARYYGNTQGRFISSDPLLNSGRPDAPDSWNRYSYTRNNPLVRIDPARLYDLNNTCNGNDKKCNEKFNHHAKDLKKGLDHLHNSLAKVNDPMKKARLEAALKAFGTEGDHNNVKVSFGSTKGGGAGETIPISDPTTYKESYEVTFDPSKIADSDDYGIAASHEGTHIDDINTQIANPSVIPLSDFSSEYRAYHTSAWAASALGHSSISFTYDKKSVEIWNSSWRGVDDKVLTNYITGFHDKSGKKTHPETTPHNPWPN
jgi:RHS repeat-associated protein